MRYPLALSSVSAQYRPVILSEAKDLVRSWQLLRCAQNDTSLMGKVSRGLERRAGRGPCGTAQMVLPRLMGGASRNPAANPAA